MTWTKGLLGGYFGRAEINRWELWSFSNENPLWHFYDVITTSIISHTKILITMANHSLSVLNLETKVLRAYGGHARNQLVKMVVSQQR